MASDSQWWQRYGNLAQIASAVIAVIGFGAIILQVSEIRQNNRSSAARQVYLAYADLNFRNPQFGTPDYDKIKTDPLLFEQYKTFVSTLLYACGEALYAFAGQPEWRKSCEYEVKAHLPFLCEIAITDPLYLDAFGTVANDFIRVEMAREKISAPDCRRRAA